MSYQINFRSDKPGIELVGSFVGDSLPELKLLRSFLVPPERDPYEWRDPWEASP